MVAQGLIFALFLSPFSLFFFALFPCFYFALQERLWTSIQLKTPAVFHSAGVFFVCVMD